MRYETIEKAVEKAFKLAESYEPYKIAKNNDVDILDIPLDFDTFGMTIRNHRHSSIILNSLIHENLREFVLCHELGHIFLHKQASTPFMRSVGAPSQVLKIEAEANRFAFELLRNQYEELDFMTKDQIVDYFQLPKYMKDYI
ncbi:MULTISPECIES: ImmA/IrrE family metallo-endopeptidase [unclassified Facklamia]|uniref:ImmA/IrrE family metallo-endopeptidase n=1 Tax=Aerococcaceae TaxID=186827 RepID=UPI0013B96EC0|nr:MULTISPECIES: ImmA/IrrE family metallo-endopeptidase [unclassified Facklamia]NEW65307.1 ImmA/IrrE family metallo-endopeptidase [Facklamia sp. 252]NEW68793.1 ImmA/IrrE family metallo-endopeptidase [Facklamia sp. 253]QQD66104.1 ImmA/IrrE family metallo-endopeptidase [Aerococcaceae bacterium zg-252]